jgi:glycosyltransferase involved in cell wall biosynthesis
VTVGVPTHNGEAFLEAALEALVRQDHENLEIVVSDNASTDRTPEIVRAFMQRDRRVRLERSETLVSAAQNFNRVLHATSGSYFMWAADDDLRDPSYVRRCLEALEAAPTAVMACTGLRFIDPGGAVTEADYDRYDNPDLSSPSVVERVRILLRRGGWYEVYGLIRRDALERTHLFQDTYGPDVMLVLELAMLGPVLKVPEPLFFYRRFPDRTERDRVVRQGGVADADSVLTAHLTHLQESMSATVAASGLSWPLKVRLRGEILWAVYVADTPIGRNARREIGDRIAAARRDRDIGALAKFPVLGILAATRQIGPAGRRLVARARRKVGRLRRRL